MTIRTIEIEDNLSEIIESVQDDLKELMINWLNENKDCSEAPDLYNDLDYDGSFHEIVDSSVPIYTSEIKALWYLYGDKFDQAFEDAGIGSKDDDWPMGYEAAAIYCYIEQEVSQWYEENKESIYDAWREENPEEITDEDICPLREDA